MSAGIRRLSAGLVILALLQPLASTAQEKAPKPAQSWTVNCASAASGDLVCTLSQVLTVKDSGQRVLTVSVTRKGDAYSMRLSLPHGLNLPNGVDVWIDDASRTNHPIVTADKSGSYAILPLDEPMIAALKKGILLKVAVTAFTGGEIVLELSLAGFTAGFAKL